MREKYDSIFANRAFDADVDSKDNYGCTPFLWVMMYGKQDVARLIIEKGAGAVKYRYVDLVHLLIDKGADVNSVDNKGHPLLWYAVQREDWSSDSRSWDREIQGEEIAHLLLDKDAIVDTDDIQIKLRNLGILVLGDHA